MSSNLGDANGLPRARIVCRTAVSVLKIEKIILCSATQVFAVFQSELLFFAPADLHCRTTLVSVLCSASYPASETLDVLQC